MPTEIEELARMVNERLPKAEVTIDHPERPTGNHWLDIRHNGTLVTVEWRPGQGFGFFADDATYGEGPNRIVESVEDAAELILQLL